MHGIHAYTVTECAKNNKHRSLTGRNLVLRQFLRNPVSVESCRSIKGRLHGNSYLMNNRLLLLSSDEYSSSSGVCEGVRERHSQRLIQA